jgi:hypothetical protein
MKQALCFSQMQIFLHWIVLFEDNEVRIRIRIHFPYILLSAQKYASWNLRHTSSSTNAIIIITHVYELLYIYARLR